MKFHPRIERIKRYFAEAHACSTLTIEREKILVFIGAPRCGTTLVGQLINYHPQCLVSNESRLIQNVINFDKDFDKELKKVEKRAAYQYQCGIENDPQYKKNLIQYQKQWKPITAKSGEAVFAKKLIKIVGDKKAGGATQAFLNHPEKMFQLLDNYKEICFLQILRNPIDAANSFLKSHPHEVKGFKEACDRIIYLSATAAGLGKRALNPYHYLFYEEMISRPVDVLSECCAWLGLDCSNHWLEMISRTVNRSFSPKEYSKEELLIAKELIKKYGAEEVYKQYSF